MRIACDAAVTHGHAAIKAGNVNSWTVTVAVVVDTRNDGSARVGWIAVFALKALTRRRITGRIRAIWACAHHGAVCAVAEHTVKDDPTRCVVAVALGDVAAATTTVAGGLGSGWATAERERGGERQQCVGELHFTPYVITATRRSLARSVTRLAAIGSAHGAVEARGTAVCCAVCATAV